MKAVPRAAAEDLRNWRRCILMNLGWVSGVENSRFYFFEESTVDSLPLAKGGSFCITLGNGAILLFFSFMSIPKKGSQLLNLDDDQFRWIAKGKDGKTEIKIQLNEVPDGQVLVGIAPRVFQNRMVESLIDTGIKAGWAPLDWDEPLVMVLRKGKWQLIAD